MNKETQAMLINKYLWFKSKQAFTAQDKDEDKGKTKTRMKMKT